MLVSSVPTLQTDIMQALLKASKGAAFKGFVKVFGDTPTTETLSIASDFAETFSSELAKNLSQPLAESIYKFVSSATITGSPVGLISPAGPVTGAVTPETLRLI